VFVLLLMALIHSLVSIMTCVALILQAFTSHWLRTDWRTVLLKRKLLGSGRIVWSSGSWNVNITAAPKLRGIKMGKMLTTLMLFAV
jgi:hypothetical protein